MIGALEKLLLAESGRESECSRRRVFRQLMESIILESLFEVEELPESDRTRFRIQGKDSRGREVHYEMSGTRKAGFGRIRSDGSPVMRVVEGEYTEARVFAQFVGELSSAENDEPDRLVRFVGELSHTWLNDVFLGQHTAPVRVAELTTLDSAELEGRLSAGHPYHPCYKSRIGFDFEDQLRYAPEAMQPFKLIWVAVHRSLAEVSLSYGNGEAVFLKRELGVETYERFALQLRDRGATVEDYAFVPVHPWQWRERIVPLFAAYMADGNVVCLGEGSDAYQPQQSIRTLSNVSERTKCSVKTALSIVNTSALRNIGAHHAHNAPLVSDWLTSITADDTFLREYCRFIVLKEVAGVSFRYEAMEPPHRTVAEGTFAAIWRESVSAYLAAGEQAVPFTAVYYRDADGTPFVQPWVERYGLEPWVKQLLHVTISPFLQLLYKYGIGLESHAQNMLLIVEDGWPVRIAIRDLPGGIRCWQSEALVQRPPLPEFRYRESSVLVTGEAHEVRDYWMDAFFHIQLYEWSMLLEEAYAVPESTFWSWAAEVIYDFQAQHPQWNERFESFDLFADTVEVGRMTSRKWFGDAKTCDRLAPNPLAAARWGGS